MNLAAQPSDQSEGVRHTPAGLADTLVRLTLLVPAVGIAALGYRDVPLDYPWWRALGELAAGCTLLVVALRPETSPAEPPLRRWARWAALAACVVLARAGAMHQPRPGDEIAAA